MPVLFKKKKLYIYKTLEEAFDDMIDPDAVLEQTGGFDLESIYDNFDGDDYPDDDYDYPFD
jgi:hypothetical protein